MKVLQTEAELKEARELTMKSIYKLNPFWSAMPPDLDEANNLLKYLLEISNRHSLVWGYYVAGKMVAVAWSYPMREYLSMDPPKCPKSKLIQYMTPYEDRLNDELKKHLIQNNQLDSSIMHDWMAIHPDYEGKNIGMAFSYDMCKFGQSLGRWSYSFGISINPMSLRLGYKFSGEVIADVTLEEAPFKGRKIQLVKYDSKLLQTIRQDDLPKPKL